MKRIFVLFAALLIVLSLGGCAMSQSQSNTRNTEAVTLGENGQKLANGIWAARGLWGGCSELAIYRHNNKYYLAANFLVRRSTTTDLLGKPTQVGTYRRYAYRIEDGRLINDLTLKDAGITSVGTRVAAVNILSGDSDAVKRALISQLVSAVYGKN